MSTDSLTYVPRHADATPGTEPEPGAAAREQALALLAASPVYARVARLLGVDTPLLTDVHSEVGCRLAQLPAGWHVLRPAGADHVVVGPAGVFAFTIAHHPAAKVWVRADAVKVNGRLQHYVSESRSRAADATRLLTALAGFDVDVQGVVAVTGAPRTFVVKQQPDDVTVVTRKTITPYLHSRPTVLDRPTVERITELARQDATWTSAQAAPGPADR
jgi:hypothetical protein